MTRYDFFINVDNLYLKTEMKSARVDIPLLKARFIYGMVLVGLGMLQQDTADQSNKNDGDVKYQSQEVVIRGFRGEFDSRDVFGGGCSGVVGLW